MRKYENSDSLSFDEQGTTKIGSAKLPWIDISVTLRSKMVNWPSYPPVKIERILDIDHGDNYTLSVISMGAHTGTHIDAPIHFIKRGIGIDKMPLEITVGQARVIEIKDRESIKLEELLQYNIKNGERILFKTANSQRRWNTKPFTKDYVFVTNEAAQHLVDCRVKVVGIDHLSIGAFSREGLTTHQTLLEGGVWIIEGLNLSSVQPGIYDLICLPIKIQQGDGAPARAIIRPCK